MTQKNKKKLSEYVDVETKEKLRQNGHTPNVYRILKKPSKGKLPKSKHSKPWIIKEVDLSYTPRNVCEAQVLVAELYRLWSATPQPKTRLLTDDPKNPQEFFVFSEEIVDFNEYIDTSVQESIAKKATPGFASLLVISLLVGQADLNTRDIGQRKNGEFVHFDDDNSLCMFWHASKSDYRFNLTSRDLESLPLIHDYVPHAWLDYQIRSSIEGTASVVTYNYLSDLINLSHDKNFMDEKYLTLLKIIATPEAALKKFVDFYVKNIEVNKIVFDMLQDRKRAIEREALLIPGFRTFLYNKKYSVDVIYTSLADFRLTGQTHFSDIYKNLEDECADKISALSDPISLETHIFERNDLTTDYKRRLLKEILIDQIQDEASLEGVYNLVNKLDTANEYHNVKQRQRNLGLSLWGYTYNGQPVSASFSDVVKVAKTRMATIALDKAHFNDDRSALEELLSKDGYLDFITAKRYRTLKKETETVVMLRSESAKAKSFT